MYEELDPPLPVMPNVVSGDVLGAVVQAQTVRGGVHFHQPPRPVACLPYRYGAVPPRAGAFQARQLMESLTEILDHHIATAPASDKNVSTAVVTGLGGVGKTQIAVDHAERVWAAGDVGVLIWVTGGAREAIVSAYAEAAADLTGIEDQDPERSARRLLEWLAVADARWLVVLDDVQRPGDLDGLWPPVTGPGRVLVTTRRQDAALRGYRRRVLHVEVFTESEAEAYLAASLADRPWLLEGAAGLPADLAYLPLALAQSVAFMIDRDVSCTHYRERFNDRKRSLMALFPEAASLPDDHKATVAANWSISVELADRLTPSGVAGPLLEAASVLDANGIPLSLFTTDAVVTWLSARIGRVVTCEDAQEGLGCLRRLSLVTLNPLLPHQNVRVHALVQRATLDATPSGQMPVVIRVAADALVELWPEVECDSGFGQLLRTNAALLFTQPGDALWQTHIHPVVWRAGRSLYDAGLHKAGVTYWSTTIAETERILGADAHDLIGARANLARCYRRIGRCGDAIDIDMQVLADRERTLGPDHPDTLSSRNHLAGDYRGLGQYEKARALHEQVLADRERILGSDHPDTLWSRSHLAWDYAKLGRFTEALALDSQVAAARDRVLGPDHPDTLWSRHNLAVDYRGLGLFSEALTLDLQVAADRKRLLGHDHPDRLSSLHNLAWDFAKLGRCRDALTLNSQVSADRERVLGPDHPDTLWSRAALADDCRSLGWFGMALEMDTRLLADRLRLLGADHPNTLASRNNLAWDHAKLGLHKAALPLKQQIAADRRRILGPDHPDTLRSHRHLASGYRSLGRLREALDLDLRVAADCDRVLGADHPDTLASLHNIAWDYLQLGRVEEALALDRRVLAERERVLGPDHPDTTWSRAAIAFDCRKLGRYEQALALDLRVAADRDRILGPEHPDTLWSRHNVAMDYRGLGRLDEALALEIEVAADREQFLGPQHPDTLTSAQSRPGPRAGWG